MSLSIGSVTINPDATASGTGAVWRVYQGMIAAMAGLLVNPASPPPGTTTASMTAILMTQKQGIANMATGIAAGVVNILLNDAVVNVTVDTGPSFNGLQRLPASFVAGADCQAPTSPHPLTGTLT